ncbi:hypothetical protein O9Z70_06785 [Devosia sp. YIM 151766]|uniref:hypothetical protein n=1 Tax=Devosia sp. YIM 151766 TaxID=3017325 RepID=UPI00255C936D|nr:hypothetical protein [Devosia sp. YIM 151766]WIY54222.1 hypothetical protein O9Z70_06785 [Devosia sp. YIM 151766]
MAEISAETDRCGIVALHPILPADFPAVGLFLHQSLNARIPAHRWVAMMSPSWQVDGPNHGFMLRDGERIVGVQLAFYSTRDRQAGTVRFCNIAAFCVLPDYRVHSLRLLRAVLAQPGYCFTDLSPSGIVQPLNLRLGFRKLDTTTALIPNMASMLSIGGMRLVTDHASIAGRLAGSDLRIFRDHRSAGAAEHVMLVDVDRYCYVIFRRDRRKNLPFFATLLHVSDPALFRKGRGQLFRHLLLQHGILFTLMELRLVRDRPLLSRLLPGHRPKMFRSADLGPEAIDYLYSELTCVSW